MQVGNFTNCDGPPSQLAQYAELDAIVFVRTKGRVTKPADYIDTRVLAMLGFAIVILGINSYVLPRKYHFRRLTEAALRAQSRADPGQPRRGTTLRRSRLGDLGIAQLGRERCRKQG